MKFYDFNVKDNKQNDVSLSEYKGKVLLVVNTATKCGLTPQYEGLESLYNDFDRKDFEILDFPCNQFLEQAPEDDAGIESFCVLNYKTTFPRFSKIEVNGENADPLYKYLKDVTTEIVDEESETFMVKLDGLGVLGSGTDIKWNFTKFLVDKDGNVVRRFPPTYTAEQIKKEVNELI